MGAPLRTDFGLGGADVVYTYTITNLSDFPVTVTSAVDDKLGDILSILPQTLLGPGESTAATKQVFVVPDQTDELTNIVTVTVEQVGGDQTCEDTAQTTVKRLPPPPPPVSCSDIKDITAVSVVWNGTAPVDVLMESGERFENVQPGNQITFQEAGTGNDVEMRIFAAGTSSLLGMSEFHVSCSDEDMNGSEDCGTDQGNGKDNDPSLINDWRFDGMDGEKGSFACGLPNIGVVAPSAAAGTGYVTAATTLNLGDDKKVKWPLANIGGGDVFITRVLVTWPDATGEHDQLKKFKLAGDFAKDLFDDDSPTTVPDEYPFESDPNKRKLQEGDTKNLEIEFIKEFDNPSDRGPADFTIVVEFDNGQVLVFP